MSDSKPNVVVSRHDTGWSRDGLRPFLEYRDLGLNNATQGRYGATVGRAVQAWNPELGTGRHTHTVGFHLIYVLRGWLRTEFEGLGETVLYAGDSISYEGKVPQTHIEYSDDFEVLQVTMPAAYQTEPVGT